MPIMFPIILNDITLIANVWNPVILPDNCRDSIRFQANSLGILKYSFDAGGSYMQTVGAGEVISGNFSKKAIWFKTNSADTVNIMVMDKLY